ncbi:hypothetical protein CNX65_24580 [Actinosynnema pretiosum]|uniref:Uncharacterized protein n=1 Tax=Actinosynnema pretiosum TaxID=42197 RepID=A0A290ZAN8_9PSEU|nr:hypothetical protein CNX65_24580 [Actinosynnema pretiosum]
MRSFMWQWDPYDVGEDRSINPNEYEDWVDELTKMIFSNVPEKAIIEAIHERMSREGLATSSKFENRFINEFAALKKTLDQAEQSSP